MPKLVQVNESITTRRTVVFDIRGTDGISPVNSEDGQQPQIQINHGGWTDVGISTLTLIGNGRYYAILDQSIVANVGDQIESRYKGISTVETPGDNYQVVGFDPAEPLNMVGEGIRQVPLTIKDINENPIEFVEVWVTTDQAGTDIVAGVLKTDHDGYVSFQLNPGTYYVWKRHPKYNFTNPTTITVA